MTKTIKRSPSVSVRDLALHDNVPSGFEVSLDRISELKSFASLFRDELRAKGTGATRQHSPKKPDSQ